MKYNPEKHHRRSIRLKTYNYSSSGLYFITICTYQRECLFGKIVDNEMQLSKFGQIIAECWQEIPKHFTKIQLDAFVIMPNHIHGILLITDDGSGVAMYHPYKAQFSKPISGSLPTIIGSFKSVTTKRINFIRNASGTSVWHRNYYEHIIRSEDSLNIIRQYIVNNPQSWAIDQLHPNNSSELKNSDKF